jgi:hypothetical protein
MNKGSYKNVSLFSVAALAAAFFWLAAPAAGLIAGGSSQPRIFTTQPPTPAPSVTPTESPTPTPTPFVEPTLGPTPDPSPTLFR